VLQAHAKIVGALAKANTHIKQAEAEPPVRSSVRLPASTAVGGGAGASDPVPRFKKMQALAERYGGAAASASALPTTTTAGGQTPLLQPAPAPTNPASAAAGMERSGSFRRAPRAGGSFTDPATSAAAAAATAEPASISPGREGGGFAVDPQERMFVQLVEVAGARAVALSSSELQPGTVPASASPELLTALDAATVAATAMTLSGGEQSVAAALGLSLGGGEMSLSPEMLTTTSAASPSASADAGAAQISDALADWLTGLGLFHTAPVLASFGVGDLVKASLLTAANLRAMESAGLSPADARILQANQEAAGRAAAAATSVVP
jgi:hypothetical protein